MKEIESPLGLSRPEYIAGVRLCPKHPAFAGTYEDWIEASLVEIQTISQKRDIATKVASKQR
jgi:hypothetical protein